MDYIKRDEKRFNIYIIMCYRDIITHVIAYIYNIIIFAVFPKRDA